MKTQTQTKSKKPLIGLSTLIFHKNKGMFSEKTVEINSKDPDFKFRRKSLEAIKKELKGKNLSMHSLTKRVFTEKDKDLRKMEINILKSEIIACKFLGCKELIVHLKQEKLNKNEVEIFKELLSFSKKYKVEILYEPNGKFNGNFFIYNLKQFKNLKVNLDLGHLNTAVVNKTLKISSDEFLKSVKDKIVYIHAHNNNGKDQHIGLNEGSLDWKGVLDKINLKKVRKIIIELHDFSYYKSTKKALTEYLK
jgi:sugar phosphate isomerase/epimerase